MKNNSNHQYFQERQKRIKLIYGTEEICREKNLLGGRLTELLLAKYGKPKLVLLEDKELKNFSAWIKQQ